MALKQIIKPEDGITFSEYPLRLYEKAFVLVHGKFVPGKDRNNPSRKIASVEDIMRELEQIKPSDPDFAHLDFAYQGSFPWSYTGEKIIGYWAMDGLIEHCTNPSELFVTESGEKRVGIFREKYSL